MKRVTALLAFIGCLWLTVTGGWAAEWNVAFYYGAHAPVDELKAFDVVVVDPDQGLNPAGYHSARSKLFAYVSVGELDGSRAYAKHVPKDWLIGENTAWQSQVIDQSQPAWAEFLVTRIIGPLWERGYRGFFLDTLDSYQLVADTPASRRDQEQGLVRVIHAITTAYPGVKLMFNRGFEIIPAVSQHVFAVAVESLYRGWDQAGARYVDVSQEDREWILQQVKALRKYSGLPVIIIDYLPPQDRDQARILAQTIEDLGFIPWVSNPELNQLGVGAIEVMPRKILAIFDGGEDPNPEHSAVHRFVDLPLNYLGYVPEHWNVETPLPDYPLTGRYAGIVTWLPRDDAPWSRTFHHWLVRQIQQGMRVVVFQSFGFPMTANLLKPFHLKTEPLSGRVARASFTVKDERIGYEIEPVADHRTFFPLTLVEGRPLLQAGSVDGQRQDVIAQTPWGGYALNPLVEVTLPDLETFRWVLDPIRFLREALALPPMPIPDTTTENGSRLLLVHIDGDGFPSRAEMPGTPFAGEVFYREILKRYPIPTTVSIIEGEVSSTGLYPTFSKKLEEISRAIFALSHVEVASHSYSHPFYWREFETKGASNPGQYHLAIPGYVYGPKALQREIRGSVEYINQHVAPPSKPVKVFLWTGDCEPSSEAVKETYALQVGNMNGGDTRITKQYNSLTAVAPLGIHKGAYFQIYAPNQNENIYTNNWLGPYYGFQQVIETFQLTDRPRRLKPINIYYHTYSASKKASLAALHKVYRWALSQDISPRYVSEYIQKVQAFNRLVIARNGDEWEIHGAYPLQELRVPQAMGYPDFARSLGLTGFSDHGTQRYLHLTPAAVHSLTLQQPPPALPYLVHTNSRVLSWNWSREGLTVQLQGSRPVTVTLAHVKRCRAQSVHETIHANAAGNRLHLQMTLSSREPVHVSCG